MDARLEIGTSYKYSNWEWPSVNHQREHVDDFMHEPLAEEKICESSYGNWDLNWLFPMIPVKD